MTTVTAQERNVCIVDDHAVVRRGLKQLINQEMDLTSDCEAANAGDAHDIIKEHLPDLVLLDLGLGGMNGLELTKQFQSNYPDIPVLIVSMHDELLYAERALAAGAKGFIMKSAPDTELLDAVRRVLDGRIYVSSRVRQRLDVKNAREQLKSSASPLERLSDRELEVFMLIGKGYAPRHIADELYMGVKTVETHRRNIKEKLNMSSSAMLARYAIRWYKDHQEE